MRAIRALLVATAALLCLALTAPVGVTMTAAALRRSARGPAPLEQVVVDLCVVLGWIALTWLAASTVATATAAVWPRRLGGATARRVAARTCPARWRRLVLTAVGGAAISGVVVSSAGAATTATDAGAVPTRPSIAGLALPDRPVSAIRTPSATTDRPPGADAPDDRPHGAPDEVVVVARGDSLWALAAARLPDGASDIEIAALTDRLHALNASVVGDDPDLLHPGQVLDLPATDDPGATPRGTDERTPR